MKTLLVIDMQNDFINGALGTKEAEAIVPFVKDKIKEYREAGNPVFSPVIRMERIIWIRRREKICR